MGVGVGVSVSVKGKDRQIMKNNRIQGNILMKMGLTGI
jgi:hypothetical protein